MKKMFTMIIAMMIALTFVGCNATTGDEFATDTADLAPTTTATATDTEPEVTAVPADNGIASARVITLATATTTQLVPSAEMLVAAYQEGNWNGSFVEEAGHCFSIDASGRLWVDCEDLWIFPDLPNGEKLRYADDIIARNSEGTWVFHQNFEADEFRFELWLRGNLVAESELVEFASYEATVSTENGLTCQTYDGVEYTLTVVRDNLIVMSDANTNPAPESFEKERTALISKLQKLFWAGSWKGDFRFIDGHYVKIDDTCNSWLNIDNVTYDVNLDVPVTGIDWSDPSLDWAIIDGVAVMFSKGEVKAILPLPEGAIELVSASCCSYRSLICLAESGTLWHVDEVETVKIAEDVIDVYAINHNLIYLRQDGTAYLFQDGKTSVFAKNATEVGFYGDYQWGAVVPEEEANLKYHGKNLWVLDNYLD